MDGAKPSRGGIWAALVSVWIIWGTTYLAIRWVDQTMPPLLAASARFLIAGVLMFIWAGLRPEKAAGNAGPGSSGSSKPTLRQWRSAAIIGTALVFGGNGLVSLAEISIPSGIAALLIALVPLWLALFDRLIFGKRLRTITVIGLVIGFAGAALLALDSIQGHFSPSGIALIICAELSWTFGSLYARNADLPKRPLLGNAMEMLCGGAVMLAVGTVLGEFHGLHPSSFSRASLIALAYLITLGSIVAFSCYVWLLRSAPTSLVSTYAFVNPVIAVTLGVIILHEALAAQTVVAGGIIVVAVALIVRSQEPPATDEEKKESLRAASGE